MSPQGPTNSTIGYRQAAEELRDNQGQWSAYESRGNCVILAGPGSGKTKALTIKLARMLAEDVQAPSGIACITYSAECARELGRRLSALGVHESPNLFIGTVHSFCLKSIVLPFLPLVDPSFDRTFSIASVSDQEKMYTDAFSVVIDDNPSRHRLRFDHYRRTFLNRNSAEFLETDPEMAEVIQLYEQKLADAKFLDFDSMILRGMELVEGYSWVRSIIKARFPILVVDEYQDLGLPLHRIVLALCRDAGIRLIAVGDPDQAIYNFAGSVPNLLESLANSDWVEKKELTLNYRCGKSIIAASIKALGESRAYESRSSKQGSIDFYPCPKGINEQATLICEQIIPRAMDRTPTLTIGNIVVVYADRNDGQVIASAAARTGFNYIRLDRGAPYRRTPLSRWLEDCACWCTDESVQVSGELSRLMRRWEDFNRRCVTDIDRLHLRTRLAKCLFSYRSSQSSLAGWLEAMDRLLLRECFESERTMKDEQEMFQHLVSVAAGEGALSHFDLARFAAQGGDFNHLNLITLHSAKGLEFEVVIMMGMDQGKVPSWSAGSAEAIREARRLFYVGLTRAKQEVHITYSGFTEDHYGRRHNRGPSQFVLELLRNTSDSKNRGVHGMTS